MRSVMLSAVAILARGERDRRRAGAWRPEDRDRRCAARAVRRWRHRAGKAPVSDEPPIVIGERDRRDASPTAARRAVRAAKMASGSTSRPISRAMSASPGSVSASATKAGSSARVGKDRGERIEQARIVARGGPPARNAATLSTRSRVASVCSACQRLNGSPSCAARNRKSSAERLATSLIGAENPRLSEGTGGSLDIVEHEGFGRPASRPGRRARSCRPPASLSGRSRPSRRRGRARAGSPSATCSAGRASAARSARRRGDRSSRAMS